VSGDPVLDAFEGRRRNGYDCRRRRWSGPELLGYPLRLCESVA
jgi:hypothetical protein